MKKPFLSLIVPAYNEEGRLPNSLQKIADFLASQDYLSEVIVVENGSQDRTAEIASDFSQAHANFRAESLDGRGKGLAVRHGMLIANGEYRMMLDADLSMPVGEINRFLPPESDGADIVIASREAPGARRFDEPEYRHLGGRVINTLIRLLALPGLQDTQCGFKCFQAEVAQDLFSAQTITGWSFDVEVLYIARQRGYSVLELPIDWYYNEQSHVEPLRDTVHMFKDLLTIRRNARRGLYGAAS
ncbi:MAG: glycosyltransferase family 2 protein [Chloroflexi bacterium]|nr:glycosyltransferase family 2 protein [Chloroflexota bacterium]